VAKGCSAVSRRAGIACGLFIDTPGDAADLCSPLERLSLNRVSPRLHQQRLCA
jgi:hypothetical protein